MQRKITQSSVAEPTSSPHPLQRGIVKRLLWPLRFRASLIYLLGHLFIGWTGWSLLLNKPRLSLQGVWKEAVPRGAPKPAVSATVWEDRARHGEAWVPGSSVSSRWNPSCWRPAQSDRAPRAHQQSEGLGCLLEIQVPEAQPSDSVAQSLGWDRESCPSDSAN